MWTQRSSTTPVLVLIPNQRDSGSLPPREDLISWGLWTDLEFMSLFKNLVMDDPLIENLIQFFPFFLVIPCFRSQLSVKYWSVRHHVGCWSPDTAVTLTQEHPHKQVTLGLIYADWVDFPYSASLFLCYRHVLQISNLRNVSPAWTFKHTFAIWLLLCLTIFLCVGGSW